MALFNSVNDPKDNNGACYCQSRGVKEIDSPECYCQNRTSSVYEKKEEFKKNVENNKNNDVKFKPDLNGHYAPDLKDVMNKIYDTDECCNKEDECCCGNKEHECGCKEKEHECCEENTPIGESAFSVTLSDNVASAILSSLIRIEEKLDIILNK